VLVQTLFDVFQLGEQLFDLLLVLLVAGLVVLKAGVEAVGRVAGWRVVLLLALRTRFGLLADVGGDGVTLMEGRTGHLPFILYILYIMG